MDDEIIITNPKNKNSYIITKKANIKLIELMGLYKFLSDYSMIYDKKSIEVSLWEQYLIFAQLFGIADKVKNQLKNLDLDLGLYAEINIEILKILNNVK